MEECMGEAFASSEHLTIIGRHLRPGGTVPDYCLNYLDLVDMAVHTVRLSDSAGLVRLLSVVNSLDRPVCQVVMRHRRLTWIKIIGAGATNVRAWLLRACPLQEPAQLVKHMTILEVETTFS
jgi:hypothetical protein